MVIPLVCSATIHASLLGIWHTCMGFATGRILVVPPPSLLTSVDTHPCLGVFERFTLSLLSCYILYFVIGRLFDSTLGYPGEGPFMPPSYVKERMEQIEAEEVVEEALNESLPGPDSKPASLDPLKPVEWTALRKSYGFPEETSFYIRPRISPRGVSIYNSSVNFTFGGSSSSTSLFL